MRSSMIKKLLVCISVALMLVILGVVCSCGNDTPDTTAVSDTAVDTAPEPVPEDKDKMLIDLSSRVYDFAQEKETRNLLESLQVGDEITTHSGIIGKIVSMKDETVTIETSKDKTKIRFLKTAIARVDVRAEDC